MLTIVVMICTLVNLQTWVVAEDQTVPKSNIKGKKLIAVTQALNSGMIDLKKLPGMMDLLQESGYDGVSLCISTNTIPGQKIEPRMQWRWWDIDKRSRSEFTGIVKTIKSINNWGRLTDNFMWMAAHVEGLKTKTPDWFNDDDWEILLANAKLGARIARELGFKGILFDMEQYEGDAVGIWIQPWDYPLYASGGYKAEEGRKTPRPFKEVQEKVRQRGQQWAQALSSEYPDMVLAVMGLYGTSWRQVHLKARSEGKLEKSNYGLFAAFVDGILLGLDERAMLVSFDEYCYLDSQYNNLLMFRNAAKEQSLVVSSVPDLARKRISYAAGLWTDAGFGADRFSNTNARMNQRDPERHKHATHNALAVSDHYAWHWSEWGNDGHSSFITPEPTPLMRQYWRANVDAREPMDLSWEPQPHHDTTDYTKADAKAAKADGAFWVKMKKQGYKVVVELPEYWKFRLDTELLCRFRHYWPADYDDSGWSIIKSTQCWQSQGTRANDPGLYRLKFDVPADIDGEKQEIVLAFGGFGSGTAIVYMNNRWVSYVQPIVDVSGKIKPGQSNQIGIPFINKTGPGGLMGHVKLLVRDRNEK